MCLELLLYVVWSVWLCHMSFLSRYVLMVTVEFLIHPGHCYSKSSGSHTWRCVTPCPRNLFSFFVKLVYSFISNLLGWWGFLVSKTVWDLWSLCHFTPVWKTESYINAATSHNGLHNLLNSAQCVDWHLLHYPACAGLLKIHGFAILEINCQWLEVNKYFIRHGASLDWPQPAQTT